MAAVLEGGEWSAARPGRTLPPGKTRYPLYGRLGGPQGRSGQVRKISPPPPGFHPRTFQPVVFTYIYEITLLLLRKHKKGKSVPLQAWSGPEGSRKLRCPDYMTMVHDGGKVVSLTHRPPLPQEMLLVLISVRGWVDPRAIVRSEGLFMSMKNSNDTSWDRTSDLPICSTAP